MTQPPRRKIILILSLCVFLFSVKSTGQIVDFSYTHYGKEDGLPSNTVYCMTADKDGVLWIGTDAGLTRFDGSHYKTFTTKDGLPSNDIFNLYCDSKNRVWVTSMAREVCYVLNQKLCNKSNESNLRKVKIVGQIVDIIEDQNNDILILSNPCTINKISNNSVQTNSIIKNQFSIIGALVIKNSTVVITSQNCFVYKGFFDKSINLHAHIITGIIAIGDSCYFVENGKVKSSHNSVLLQNYFRSSLINWVLFSDQNSKLWKLSNNGILSFKLSDLDNPISYLKNYSVSFFCSDFSRNNWVSTLGNGLFKINSNNNLVYKNDLSETSNKFQSLAVNDNFIFLGDNNGEFTLVNKKSRSIIKRFKLNTEAPISFRILKIDLLNKDNVILTTDNGVYVFNVKTNSLKLRINTGCKSLHVKQHDMFVLTGAGIIKCNLNSNDTVFYRFNKRLYSYLEFNKDTIIGAEDGLYLFDGRHINTYKLNEPFTNRVMDLTTQDSILVVATINSGLYFIRNHEIIRKVNIENGLSSNNCFKIIKYKNDFVIATSNGISFYNYESNQVKAIFESDGLASNTVNDITIDHDTLYAATENGLSIIPLLNLTINRNFLLYNKPTIVNKDTIWTKDSTFRTRTDFSFNINLNSLSYGTKGPIVYYYRYSKNNADTTYYTTSDQLIPLVFKETGNYIFEAYARDMVNNKSNVLRLYIKVIPYYYQTTLFKILEVLFILFAVFYLVYFIIKMTKKMEEQKRLREDKVHDLELSAWRSKLNPHFLFNSISSVDALIKTDRLDKASNFLNSFSDILRKTISNSGKLLNTIQSEMDYINEFLKIEMLKRDNAFVYTITCADPALQELYIPTMLIQPVVENSLKYAIRSRKNGELSIYFEREHDAIKCTIRDNGDGLTDSNTATKSNNSFGLKLISEKIALLESVLDKKISFTFTMPNKELNIGAIAIFIFPVLTSNRYD